MGNVFAMVDFILSRVNRKFNRHSPSEMQTGLESPVFVHGISILRPECRWRVSSLSHCDPTVFIGKLLYEAFEETDAKKIEAITATGVLSDNHLGL